MDMMVEERNRRRLIGIGIALGVHLLFIAILFFLTLEGHLPKPKETELLLVNLGNVEQASGEEEPAGLSEEIETTAPSAVERPAPIVQPKPQPEARPKVTKPIAKPQPKPQVQPIQTQSHEESLRLAEAKRKADEQAKMLRAEEERRRAQAEVERRAADEAKRQQEAAEAEAQRKAERTRAAGARVSNAFGAGKSASKGQGTATSGAGNQGSLGGSSGSYSLAGRTIVSNGGRLNTPKTSQAIRGRVNVRITVDASGRVTDAHVDPKGTNIAESSVRLAAVTAARSTKFNAQEGAQEQKGIITYDFDIE